MKKSFLLAAALAGVALTGSAFAYDGTESANAAARAARPVPSKVVSPTGLPSSFAGAIVNVEFTLDESGRPHDIKVQAVSDAVVKRQVLQAFQQWKFESASRKSLDGKKRFVLPIEIVPEA